MSAFYSPRNLRRLHQLHGTNGISQAWSEAGQLNFKFDDIPATMVALGRKHINYVGAIRLNFEGAIVSTAGTTLDRKVLTPMLMSSVQIHGTEIGSPVSSTHMLGGIIDTDSYIRKGGRNDLFNPTGMVLAAGVSQPFNYTVDIVLGHFGQNKGHQTCPLALFLQPGEMLINIPQTLASVDATLSDTSLTASNGSGSLKVTAHAVLIPSTEILIANPWQLTRHKAAVGANTDNVQIASFGNASTLTGVQSKCGIGALLWAGDGLIGPAKGAGTVASITQFAADFLGMRQNNDPRAIVQQLFSEIVEGTGFMYSPSVTEDNNNPLYPFFDLETAAGGTNNFDVMDSAEFFPIISPTRNFDASKLLEAVGNPSYDITGTFTTAAHYTYMEGCYPFTMDALNSLLAIIQRSHIGQELYGTDDLIMSTKTTDNADPMDMLSEPSKLTYLPRTVIPRSKPAVK